jgi:hypothetical protein
LGVGCGSSLLKSAYITHTKVHRIKQYAAKDGSLYGIVWYDLVGRS